MVFALFIIPGDSSQPEVTKFSKANGILGEAYSPLATGRILDNQDIKQIADKYHKTVAQISIRYCLQQGTVPLPKSTHEKYIVQNAEVDFEISEEDMAKLGSLESD